MKNMNKKIKITICVGGVFHAFNVARVLDSYNALRKIITSYPYFKLKKWSTPLERKKISCVFIAEILFWLFKKIFIFKNKASYTKSILFDWLSSFIIPKDTDVFIGFPSVSYYTLKKFNYGIY